MRVLVSGGAGYIGSHTVVQLLAAGHEVVVVDSFANAKPAAVGRMEALSGATFPVHAFSLTDRDKTEAVFADTKIDAVIHFAGFKAVGESVVKPYEYYENNLETTLSLVRLSMRSRCTRGRWAPKAGRRPRQAGRWCASAVRRSRAFMRVETPWRA